MTGPGEAVVAILRRRAAGDQSGDDGDADGQYATVQQWMLHIVLSHEELAKLGPALGLPWSTAYPPREALVDEALAHEALAHEALADEALADEYGSR